jgi:hypothetical protein
LGNNINELYIITIQDGTYTPKQLATELENKLNEAINDFLATIQPQPVPPFSKYSNFKVHYDEVGNSLYFGNTEDEFIFKFSQTMPYTLLQCEQPNVFQRCTQWGLPWYLGFQKIDYPSIELLKSNGDKDIIFYYETTTPWLEAGSGTIGFKDNWGYSDLFRNRKIQLYG